MKNGSEKSKFKKPNVVGSRVMRVLLGAVIAGWTITGSKVQTAVSGARVALENTGFFQFDSSGNHTFEVDVAGFVRARWIYGLDASGTHLANYLSLANERFEFVKSNTIYIDPANATIALGSGPAALLIKTAGGQTIDLMPSASLTASVDTTGINLASGKVLKVNNVQVVGAQGAAVGDASGGSVVDVEARAAINALLARMRAHGSIAT